MRNIYTCFFQGVHALHKLNIASVCGYCVKSWTFPVVCTVHIMHNFHYFPPPQKSVRSSHSYAISDSIWRQHEASGRSKTQAAKLHPCGQPEGQKRAIPTPAPFELRNSHPALSLDGKLTRAV